MATLIVSASGCDFERDYVAPGFYGPMQAGSASSMRPSSLSSAPDSQLPSSGGAGSDDMPAPFDAGTASGKSSNSRDAGSGSPPPMDDAKTSASANDSMRCDMSGRWLFTTHTTTDAIGQLQYAHYYFYYDIERKGDAFSVRKGLMCGTDAIGGGAFAVTVDFSSARAATMRKLSFQGQTIASVATGSSCKITFDKFYVVMGATVPHYLDPTHVLPTVADKATGNTPGWEDWDEDGQPGITGVISGVLNGKVFAAPRNWVLMTGEVPDVRTSFQLPVKWDAEPNVMAVDGSPLLASEAVRAADPKLHFVQFARLQTDQATGDDEATCKTVIQLAPKLTPAAAGM